MKGGIIKTDPELKRKRKELTDELRALFVEAKTLASTGELSRNMVVSAMFNLFRKYKDVGLWYGWTPEQNGDHSTSDMPNRDEDPLLLLGELLKFGATSNNKR